MGRVRIALELTLQTPLSIGAGGSAGTIADKSIVRDGYGRPLIPGSQVKGKTRHAVESLVSALGLPVQKDFNDDDPNNPNIIRLLFGSPEHRSPLKFADLPGQPLSSNGKPLPFDDKPLNSSERADLAPIRPAVAINRRRGTADDQRLVFQETAVEGLTYHSEHAVVGVLEEQWQAALIWAGLRLTPRWGGAKSRGLGWAEVQARVFWDAANGEHELTAPELSALLHRIPLKQEAR